MPLLTRPARRGLDRLSTADRSGALQMAARMDRPPWDCVGRRCASVVSGGSYTPAAMGKSSDLENEALALLRRLTGDPATGFRADQLEAILALAGERGPGAAGAADRLGQERRVLHRHPAAARPGARPDASGVSASGPHAQPDRGCRAARGPCRHHQQLQP